MILSLRLFKDKSHLLHLLNLSGRPSSAATGLWFDCGALKIDRSPFIGPDLLAGLRCAGELRRRRRAKAATPLE